jgi:hypothetical protein
MTRILSFLLNSGHFERSVLKAWSQHLIKTEDSFMKRLTALLFALVVAPIVSSAASLTCADIQKAAASGAVSRQEFTSALSNVEELEIRLLRQTLVIYGEFTEQDVATAKVADLYEEYDPLFRTLLIGDKEFQAVDIDRGDNPFVFLFEKDTGVYTGVRSDDGSVAVDNVYCETEGDLF